VVLDGYAGSWFIVDSSNTVIVSVMVEKQGNKAAGEKQGRKPWTLREFGGKTLWDWMGLLIVPVVLSLITVVFAWQQDIRQDQIETKRAKAERELARERAQDQALQAYLDQMSNLLLERNLRESALGSNLPESASGSEVRTLARARTLTVLSRLNSARKARLLQFLYETGLLHKEKPHPHKEKPVIDLNGADLSGIDLHNNNLSGGGAFLINVSRNQFYEGTIEPSKAANLSGAILNDANLERAVLDYTNLENADLEDADLSHASLSETHLSNANLSHANLSHHANLDGADLSYADLTNADLSDVVFEGFRAGDLNLTWAVLKDADLSDANLSGANLSNANLSNANLAGANLSGADLSNAHMYGVEGITKEELEKQTSKLEGAIMPDGTFSSDEFEPALSFRLSEDWEIDEAPDWISIYDPGTIYDPGSGQLLFTNPRQVFDPSNPSEQKEVPAPENVDEWVSWFQTLESHPNLETSKPAPASVGGASGMRIAVAVTSTPENYPKDLCSEHPCVPLYPLTERPLSSYEGWKSRFIIVDVGGEPVVIDVSAPAARFDEFLPKAQKVLDTVKRQE